MRLFMDANTAPQSLNEVVVVVLLWHHAMPCEGLE
jgi:hypothetical protein